MLDYLGPELFGLWATAASISALAAFADLGLGNGLLTRLSAAAAKGEVSNTHQLVANAYAVSVAFCLLLAALAAVALALFDPRVLVGYPPHIDQSQVRLVVVICVAGFLLTVPLSLVQRVQYAVQLGWQSNAWQTLGGALMLVLVIGSTNAGLPPETVIACAVLATPIGLLANSLYFYGRQRRDLGPWGVRLDRIILADIFKLGFAFFCLSILTSIALNIDNFLIANTSGLADVADYSVAFRLFSMLGFLVTLIALPLWPANSEAIAMGDLDWVSRSTARIASYSVLVVLVAGTTLTVFRSQIFSLWLGAGTTVDFWLAAGLSVWAVLLAGASPYFSVQNAVGRLRYQYVGWTLYLIVSIALKLLFIPRMGISAVPIAASGTYLLVLLPTAYLGYRWTMSSQRAAIADSSRSAA